MSKVKVNASVSATSALQPQGPSASAGLIDRFAHQYDRGGANINGKASYTVDQAADFILRDGAAWKDLNKDGTISLTYTFLNRAPSDFYSRDLGSFSQFSSLQKDQAKLAMQSWADVAR
jgi:serralysin